MILLARDNEICEMIYFAATGIFWADDALWAARAWATAVLRLAGSVAG